MATKKLEVLITGNAQGAIRSLKETDRAAGGVGSRFAGVGRKIAAGFLVAGAAAVGFAIKSAHTFEKVGTETLKLQKYTGQSAEEASKLRFAFQQTGVSVDKGAKALGIFSKNVVKSKDSQKDFGFAVKGSGGHLLPMNTLLGKAADKFRTLHAGAERTAWVMKLFGKSGMDMTKFLALGSKGMAALAAQAQKYGLVLTENNLGAVKKAIQGHRDMDAAMQGVQVQIGQHVLPILTKMMKFIATEIPKATAYVKDHAWGFRALGVALGVVAAAFVVYKVAMVASTIATTAWGIASGIAGAASAVFSLGLDGLALSAMYAADAVGALMLAAAPLAVPIAAVAVVLGGFALNARDAAKNAAHLKQGISELRQQMDSLGISAKQAALNALVEKFTKGYDLFHKWGIGAKELGTAITGTDKAFAKFVSDKVGGKINSIDEAQLVSVLKELRGEYVGAGRDSKRAAAAKRELNAASAEGKNQEPGQTQSIKAAIAANKAWKKTVDDDWASLNKLQNLKMAALNADIGYAQAVSDETRAFKDNGRTLDINTQKGRDNMNAAAASRQAIMAQAQALRDNGASAQVASAFIQRHTFNLGVQEVAAGLSWDQVNRLNAAMGMTPKDINTAFHTNTGQAMADVAKYNQWLLDHPGMHTTYEITQGQHNMPGGHPGQKGFRAGALRSLRGSGSSGGNIIIQVSGSVVTERQLVEAVRTGAVLKQRQTGRPWLPAT